MSTDFDTNPMIERVRKILALAEAEARLGNTKAADSYNETASRIISKYGIDRAILASKGEIEDEVDFRNIPVEGDFVMDRCVLLKVIGESLGARVVRTKTLVSGTRRTYSYVNIVIAYQSDLERIAFLFELLQSQMVLGAAAVMVPMQENARSFRKSWMNGFSVAISERLQRNEKNAADEADSPEVSTALVLADRSGAVDTVFTMAFPKVNKVFRKINGSGIAQGYEAGQRASMGDNALAS